MDSLTAINWIGFCILFVLILKTKIRFHVITNLIRKAWKFLDIIATPATMTGTIKIIYGMVFCDVILIDTHVDLVIDMNMDVDIRMLLMMHHEGDITSAKFYNDMQPDILLSLN